jgi:hypothetical protein
LVNAAACLISVRNFIKFHKLEGTLLDWIGEYLVVVVRGAIVLFFSWFYLSYEAAKQRCSTLRACFCLDLSSQIL